MVVVMLIAVGLFTWRWWLAAVFAPFASRRCAFLWREIHTSVDEVYR